MGMSTHITGYQPPDKEFMDMKEVWVACNRAGVPVPKEVSDFFFGEDPGDGLQEVDISRSVLKTSENGCDIWNVNLKMLPGDVTQIEFKNCY